MKGLCYMVLILAVMLFIVQSPMIGITIVLVLIGLFIYFQRRKNGGVGGGFLSSLGGGRTRRQGQDLTSLLLLMALQPPASPEAETIDSKPSEHAERIERLKQEALDLLRD